MYLRDEIKQAKNFDEIVTQSKAFQKVLRSVEQVAPTHTTVLILGESGTGKELLARAVHNRSGRKNRPLVKINCAALPATLIESELFGHEKGSFTGATAQKVGRFELADGGTIFLDERRTGRTRGAGNAHQRPHAPDADASGYSPDQCAICRPDVRRLLPIFSRCH